MGLIVAAILRDRRIARDIGIAALMLSILALAPIMFWRLLIDRVLYYHTLDTLAVLCVAMLVLIVFETIFGYMRRFLVLHVTARVDVKLSTYMFDKVLSLPLDFFERSSTGVITRDMNEIFKIRNFLTGPAVRYRARLRGIADLSSDHVLLQRHPHCGSCWASAA